VGTKVAAGRGQDARRLSGLALELEHANGFAAEIHADRRRLSRGTADELLQVLIHDSRTFAENEKAASAQDAAGRIGSRRALLWQQTAIPRC
jgi:hypothetical protein